MKISDEQLSAFLDAELPENDMEQIRQQLAVDETLSDRLAELAMADQLVQEYAAQIDQMPMSESLTHLLQAPPRPNNVIAFPLWRRVQNTLQQHRAMAASVALLLGVGVLSWSLTRSQTDPAWDAVAAVLNNTPSHVTQKIANDTSVTPLLSFASQQNGLCRQYRQRSPQQAQINIACRDAGKNWQLIASFADTSAGDEHYQTAAQNDASKALIDQMIRGELFDAQQERNAIADDWQTDQQ